MAPRSTELAGLGRDLHVPALGHQPPATSRQPPATWHQPPAASRRRSEIYHTATKRASSTSSIPEKIDKCTAKQLAGDRFDEAQWAAAEKDAGGKIIKTTWDAATVAVEAAVEEATPADAASTPPIEGVPTPAPAPAPAPDAAPVLDGARDWEMELGRGVASLVVPGVLSSATMPSGPATVRTSIPRGPRRGRLSGRVRVWRGVRGGAGRAQLARKEEEKERGGSPGGPIKAIDKAIRTSVCNC